MNDERPSLHSMLAKAGRTNSPTPAPSGESQNSEYAAFAYGRIGRHTQPTLLLRCGDGSIRVFAYAYFYGAESDDPANSFVLDFTQHKVRISGRNLESLLRHVCQHRVAEIREVARAESFNLPSDDPLVECIKIQNTAD